MSKIGLPAEKLDTNPVMDPVPRPWSMGEVVVVLIVIAMLLVGCGFCFINMERNNRCLQKCTSLGMAAGMCVDSPFIGKGLVCGCWNTTLGPRKEIFVASTD